MGRNEAPFTLLRGEEVLLTTRPHFLGMAGLMLFWLFIGALGAAHFYFYPRFQAELLVTPGVDFLSAFFSKEAFLLGHAYDVIWVGSLVLPLVIMAVFRINFAYVLTLLLLIALKFLLQWKVEPKLTLPAGGHVHLENFLLLLAGLVGVIGCEFFRRGHRYYLTTHRIVARFGNFRVSERAILYSKIDDLILQQGVLGRIFDFGTLIPITSSGLGMGQDFALAGAQAGAGKGPLGAGIFAAGGKVQNVPRELSFYVLYKIKDPKQARDLIIQEMQAREFPPCRGGRLGKARGGRGDGKRPLMKESSVIPQPGGEIKKERSRSCASQRLM